MFDDELIPWVSLGDFPSPDFVVEKYFKDKLINLTPGGNTLRGATEGAEQSIPPFPDFKKIFEG